MSETSELATMADAETAARPLDLLLLGDNQFFGINHMSEEKARAQAIRFQDTSAIIDVIDIALDHGIRTLMCTTHDRIGKVCDHMRANPEPWTKTFDTRPGTSRAAPRSDHAVVVSKSGSFGP